VGLGALLLVMVAQRRAAAVLSQLLWVFAGCMLGILWQYPLPRVQAAAACACALC
jgi:hypothetical protein